ncbi:hypothetical protein BS78_04G315900 [Paspalum vaginatum]|nr:hypothetical protein BS78_04G315900 [Paspalum vaginatum]
MDEAMRTESADLACDIARLPEELLSALIARGAPRDACRAGAVSQAFRAAADSDAVWACFLPRDLPPLPDADGVPAPPSKKALFMRLCDTPVLLPDVLTSMWLDRETGAKCYMLSTRMLGIAWGDTPRYWRWIPITGSSFSEAAELLHVWWLEIRGKIDSRMLSRSSTYAAYIVFKVPPRSYGLAFPCQHASIHLGGSTSTCLVRLDGNGVDSDDEDEDPAAESPPVPEIPVRLPQERADGWMELEMGEFHNDQGEDGEVSISLMETSAVKSGLVVQGIEIRPKKQTRASSA